jgi:ferrous iron transport protein B
MVLRRAFDGGWLFVKRAGTLILASMVVIWALLYFPGTDAAGQSFEMRVAALEAELKEPLEELASVRAELQKLDEDDADDGPRIAELRQRRHELAAQVQPIADVKSEWKSHSFLGRVGKFIEPAVEPLGWDWRIGLAALASFPAREVMVGTLGIIFNQGEGKSDDVAYRDDIGNTMHEAFTVPVALSVMVFFALCCQCASTLVVIKRETNSWLWPVFTFTYMTVLAYVCALVVYQVGRLFL